MTTQLGDWIKEQLPETRMHILRHQMRYFADARLEQRLFDWLTDFGFLEAKLEAVGITVLINDYDHALPLLSGDKHHTLKTIQDALRLSAHVLAEDRHQLAGQLLGRLLFPHEQKIRVLLQQAQQAQKAKA